MGDTCSIDIMEGKSQTLYEELLDAIWGKTIQVCTLTMNILNTLLIWNFLNFLLRGGVILGIPLSKAGGKMDLLFLILYSAAIQLVMA